MNIGVCLPKHQFPRLLHEVNKSNYSIEFLREFSEVLHGDDDGIQHVLSVLGTITITFIVPITTTSSPSV